jgi:hypothetical protein
MKCLMTHYAVLRQSGQTPPYLRTNICIKCVYMVVYSVILSNKLFIYRMRIYVYKVLISANEVRLTVNQKKQGNKMTPEVSNDSR